jgi:hypothetical protein
MRAIDGLARTAAIGIAMPHERSVSRSSMSDSSVSPAVNPVGVVIRYAFYSAGAIAFALIAFSILKVFNAVAFYRVQTVDEVPSFRLVDSDLARLPMQTKVISGGATGRTETRHYGQPYDRSLNLTVILSIRPAPGNGLPVTRSTFADVQASLNNSYYSGSSGSGRYDLETRFGPVRATDTRISADGLIKPCLSFQSRFETPLVRLEGSYCEASGAKPSPHRLACMLDSLVLDTRLAVVEADVFLREHMTRRANCTATPVSQTIDAQSKSVSPPARWSMPSAVRR